VRRLRPREGLHWDLLPNLDPKLAQATQCWSKRGKPVVFKASSVNKMTIVNMQSLNTLQKLSVLCDQTRKSREVTVSHKELLRLY